VVIATKDRPVLLPRVLGSIRRQTLPDFEVVVVDDGSSPETVEAYPLIWSGLDERFRLQLNPPGSGPGGARNAGIRLARGEFVAFCDDDDTWVRDDHLETALKALVKLDGDVYLANMQISFNGTVIVSDWYGKFGQLLERLPLSAEGLVFDVRKRDLARFLRHRPLHANTLIVRRQLIVDIGLYWDRVLIGEDLNLSFRLADAARRILYCPVVAAEGDGSPHSSITRRSSSEESAFSVISGLLHAQFYVRDSHLRRTLRRLRAFWMVQLSALLLADGKKRLALEFVTESLRISVQPAGLRQFAKCLLRLGWPGPPHRR
jgi:glycosyltransferase involved in cell wall biosynthesis